MPKRNKGPHLHWDQRREIWYIRWFEGGKARVRSTGTGDRRRAEGELARYITGAQAGPTDPASRPIGDVLKDYATDRVQTVTEPRTVLNAINRLLEWWGDRTVDDISEGQCRAYGTWRESGKSRRAVKRGTWRYELAILRAAVYHDWRHRRLATAVPIWLPKGPEPRTRWLTRREVASLLRGARAGERGHRHLSMFILMGLYTGARKEAILSLRWSQVDFSREVIDFNQPGRERTSKGRAVIPIPRRLMTFLRIARKKGSEEDCVITFEGRQLKSIRNGWDAARERAGLDRLVVPHTLRHTAASWMVQKGVPLYDVAKWLGHSSIAQVQSTYGHLSPDHLDRARRALDGW